MPDKLKQRELWVTIGGALAIAIGKKIGMDPEQVYSIGAIVVGYALSRGMHKAAEAKAAP